MRKRNKRNGVSRVVNKLLLSAFVVISFIGYALENRGASANNGTPVTGAAIPTHTFAPTATSANNNGSQQSATNTAPTQPVAPSDTSVPTDTPNPTSTPMIATTNGYKDGTYNGPVINVNWGYVQVQATVQGGKISNVQFLQYPHDRFTSVRINQIADPMLDQEAIQAQSANIDIISGATLTSEGFQYSLQNALSQAKG